MSDSDKSLDILIRILTEQVGAEKAQDILSQVKAESGKAGDAIGGLTQQTEIQVESSLKLTGLHREMRSALLAIAQQSPATGAALGSVFLGPVGAIIGAIALFREAKSALDDYNKGLDAEAAAAAESFDNSVHNMQEAVDGLAKARAKFIAQMAGAGADKDPIATQIKNENDLYDIQLTAIKKIIEAHDKLLGKSQEQIAADLATIGEQKEKHTLDQLTREYFLRDANQTDLDKKNDAAQKAKADADLKATNQATERAKLEKQITEQSKKATDAAQKAQNTPKEIVLAPGDEFTPATIFPNPAHAAAQQAAQRAQDDLKRSHDRLAQLNKDREKTETSKAQADSAATTADQAAISNAQRVGDLNRQIGQQQAVDRTNAAGKSVTLGVDIADEITSGAKVTADQARYLVDVASRIAGHQLTLAQSVTALETAVRNPAAMAKQIDRITAILGSFDPSAIDRLDRRLDEIENRQENRGP